VSDVEVVLEAGDVRGVPGVSGRQLTWAVAAISRSSARTGASLGLHALIVGDGWSVSAW
jgi:hypothetical protein